MPDGITYPEPALVGGRMPAEIAKAIVQIMSGVKRLGKDDTNPHERYKFTSIDAFLEMTGRLCAEAGLAILADEDQYEIFERQGRNGTQAWLRVTYRFTLIHESGAMWDKSPRRTVTVLMNGPQAWGSAQSYCLKQFMRSMFQIPCGDAEDADFQPAEPMGGSQVRQTPQDAPKPKPQPAPAPEAKANPDASGEAEPDNDYVILRGIIHDARRAKTPQVRENVLRDRGSRISEILERRPDLQARWLTALDQINKQHLVAAE
jgi:hypothetical protein